VLARSVGFTTTTAARTTGRVEMAAEAAQRGEWDASSDSTVIDCDHCTMRGIGCGDCVVTVLLGGPPFGVELDEVEERALEVLADAGLVPPLRMVKAREGGAE
jgi:hypothetical protein